MCTLKQRKDLTLEQNKLLCKKTEEGEQLSLKQVEKKGAEMSDIENGIESLKKSWFFENNNGTDQPLTRLSSGRTLTSPQPLPWPLPVPTQFPLGVLAGPTDLQPCKSKTCFLLDFQRLVGPVSGMISLLQ